MKKTYFITLCFLLISTLNACPKIFVGIAGGTGSGKTTFAKHLHEAFPEHSILVDLDSYYYDLSHIPFEELKYFNFDHPDAINLKLLEQHLIALKNDKPVSLPSRDFLTQIQSFSEKETQPAEIILVEGMLLFTSPAIRDLLDLKIFIDISDDVRLLRIIERDTEERGKNIDHIRTQYLNTTKPMHAVFVETSKQYADIIVPHGGHNQSAIDLVCAKLQQCLKEQEP